MFLMWTQFLKKESNFTKEKNTQAEKVNKEDDPFLEW